MTGKRALLEMLKAEGVEYIFGNPGTSEGPIVDMLGDYPEFKYILTLQESVAVGMGESYARATGRASFVSLHVDSGLANGIALMLDAYNTGTPMVVTSANYDARKVAEGKTDLAELVRPVTKWAVELTLPDQIPGAIRRAFNEANSHPKGPVYVGFSSNCLEGSAEMNIIPSHNIHDASRPDLDGIKKASSLLKSAKHPVMIVGDRVSDDQAVGQAVELAELLGLPVYQSGGAEVSFPTDHPQYLGLFSLGVTAHRELLKNVDLVLSVGMDVFQDVFYWGDVLSNSSAKLVHIDSVANKVGQAAPTDVGIVSHCGLALHELINSLKTKFSKENIYTFLYEDLKKDNDKVIGQLFDVINSTRRSSRINAPKIENKIIYRSLSGLSIVIVLFIYKLMKPFNDKLYYNHETLLYNYDNSVVKPGLFSDILNWVRIRGFFQDYLDRFVYIDQFFIDRLKRKLEPYEDHFEKDIIFYTKQAHNK